MSQFIQVESSVFELRSRAERSLRIDLESVRETLHYIESDFRGAPGYETVAAAISAVLSEIDRVEGETRKDKPLNVVTARFLPSRF